MPTHSLYLTNSKTIYASVAPINTAQINGENVILSSVPTAPVFLTELISDNSILLSFTTNQEEASIIENYQYSLDGGISYITMESNQSPYTITGLSYGVNYSIKMKAVNAMGEGTESTYSTNYTPTTTASAPTITSITTSSGTAYVYFDAPTFDGGTPITNYAISTGGMMFFYSIIPQTTSPLTITGLSNGNTYEIVIKAMNNKGFGLPSNIYTKVMPTTPSAPTINSITTPTNTTAIINFTAPTSDGGLEITNYQYSTDAGASFIAFNPTQTTTPLTITNLTPGQSYNIQLRAVNSINPGSATESYPITMPNKASATGGTIIPNVGGYKYHIFTTTGSNSITFTQGGETNAVEYLIIAGGGAGGNSHGGGGGAGEVFQGSTTATATSYTINVGTGGLTNATNGGDSSAFSITCKGGGRGGGASTGLASSGGSGGGGSGYNNPLSSATTAVGASTKTGGGLGNAGGLGNQTTIAGGGGGGGGAGGVGGDGGANLGGTNTAFGGTSGSGTNAYSVWINAIATTMDGIVTNWSSKTTGGFIASGGAGGSWGKPSAITANVGGGGDGGTNNNTPVIAALPGTANTGGGGGGGGSSNQSGASGGSGLVVIRYLV